MTEDQHLREIIQEAVTYALNRGAKDKKYVDVGRIPFICDDIRAIHSALKEMNETKVTKDDFILIRNIVFGFVGLIVLAFMGALFTLVFI